MYCGKKPYKVIVTCVAVVAVCCLGLLRFQVETNPQRLWVGAGSLAAKEKAQYEVSLAPLLAHPLPVMSREESLVTK